MFYTALIQKLAEPKARPKNRLSARALQEAQNGKKLHAN